jgi:hypothetical protein
MLLTPSQGATYKPPTSSPKPTLTNSSTNSTLFHKDIEFKFLPTGSIKAFYSLKDKVTGGVTVVEEAPRYRTPAWVANFPFDDLTDIFDDSPTTGIINILYMTRHK